MPRPLLIASLGNPPPSHTNTLHSAGHTLLSALREALGYPPFARDRSLGNGLVSRGGDFTLWQSPSLMNVSGKAVAGAWKGFLRDLSPDDRAGARLVVVHDELESPLGKIKVKKGGSPRGHNGIKSCSGSLGGMEFWRVGVGIGRPESRESGDVAAYVMRKMTVGEVMRVKGGVEEVLRAVNDMRDG
ncbi:Peptidyl-tRNA hydrolase, conserved site [Lasallia pustulata]|uniref:peptidyl-tRNA hydrolase n=1 Tax=Lasallia pustulata TaxID=136370 RepID=A0A1W5D7U0_9LECA|nr:Peptidyl-tRNA hydrolase, conserved site [Lasallia pustulata]